MSKQPLNLRMLKTVMLDMSRIMDFFMTNPEKRENLFVFFHKDIPMAQHEALFKEYSQTLNSLFANYCHGVFWVTSYSYESYQNEIQIRYQVIKSQ